MCIAETRACGSGMSGARTALALPCRESTGLISVYPTSVPLTGPRAGRGAPLGALFRGRFSKRKSMHHPLSGSGPSSGRPNFKDTQASPEPFSVGLR